MDVGSNLEIVMRHRKYNYFYDKYDLLNYDWSQFTHTDLNHDDYQEYMNLFLKNLIVFLSEKGHIYQKIIYNNADSIFSANMHEYIEEQILLKLKVAISI